MHFKYYVTTIDVEIKDDPVEDIAKYGEDAKCIEFSGAIPANEDNTSVAFLMDVRKKEIEARGVNDKTVYLGFKVSREVFQRNIISENKKVLACIHGFGDEPTFHMESCSNIQNHPEKKDGGENYIVIPVIWPTAGGLKLPIPNPFDYWTDQSSARQAGIAFSGIAEISTDVPISLMCHSMGNRVLAMYAKNVETVEKRFDSIFMVAADVWEEIFNERVINPSWYWRLRDPIYGKAGLNLCKMLKDDNSKIYIVHYKEDMALRGSVLTNPGNSRLGRYGKKAQDDENRLHPECKDKLEDFNVEGHGEEILGVDGDIKHNYHHAGFVVDYYREKMNV
eukprot:CAMPEP_0194132600 /NCGR_PEP_ID=MMETSP0152-20130528/3031_1 /TAXON_ID=1049557 /ORGANISM="Thalassiothrix antarctica, Strain L6-D1" /LENGTH=335 /DNA_ID=CAMNT_0038827705 /DNA_START=61 /DNA_END=1068 /DNA_ORIENTATION=+